MTHQSTYTLLQTTHPQLSNKSKNLLAVGYLITLQVSGFFNKHIYDNALKYCRYRQALEFIPPKGKAEHRNIIWFNPPYKCITSNMCRDFPNLITKHFPNNSLLTKIFNRNNIKVSYSCTNNMSKIKKNYNKKNQIHQQYNTPHQPMQLQVQKHIPPTRKMPI